MKTIPFDACDRGTTLVTLSTFASPGSILAGVLAGSVGYSLSSLLRFQFTGILEGLSVMFIFLLINRWLSGRYSLVRDTQKLWLRFASFVTPNL